MSDINFWSKFYWESDLINWKNLEGLLEKNKPEELALSIINKIKEIDVNYFKETSEYSLSYRPSIENDKKFSKLKKALNEQKKNINLNEFIKILNKKENGVIFLYCLLVNKKTSSMTDESIRKKVKNYDKTVLLYLKNSLINQTEKKQNITTRFYFIGRELNRLVNEKYKSQMLVLNFYDKEKYQDWFKENLHNIINQNSFLYFNSNYLIQASHQEMKKWNVYLKENTSEKDLKKFMGSLSAELVQIYSMVKKEQLTELESFIQLNAVDYQHSFRKVLFSQIESIENITYWYDTITFRLSDKKIFFEEIWKKTDSQDGKVNYEANLDSELINFIIKEMSKYYDMKSIEKLDFSEMFISNENVNDVLKTKIRYYLLDNKLENKNIKKGIKI